MIGTQPPLASSFKPFRPMGGTKTPKPATPFKQPYATPPARSSSAFGSYNPAEGTAVHTPNYTSPFDNVNAIKPVATPPDPPRPSQAQPNMNQGGSWGDLSPEERGQIELNQPFGYGPGQQSHNYTPGATPEVRQRLDAMKQTALTGDTEAQAANQKFQADWAAMMPHQGERQDAYGQWYKPHTEAQRQATYGGRGVTGSGAVHGQEAQQQAIHDASKPPAQALMPPTQAPVTTATPPTQPVSPMNPYAPPPTSMPSGMQGIRAQPGATPPPAMPAPWKPNANQPGYEGPGTGTFMPPTAAPPQGPSPWPGGVHPASQPGWEGQFPAGGPFAPPPTSMPSPASPSPQMPGVPQSPMGATPGGQTPMVNPGSGPLSQPPLAQNFGAGSASYGTSITPQDLYTPSQTAHSVAEGAGRGFEMADPHFAMKQFTRPGLSQDAGTLSAAMPGMAQGVQSARDATTQIPIRDALANRAFRLQGEQAQGQEGIGLAQILRQLQQTRDNEQLQGMSPLLQILLSGGM